MGNVNADGIWTPDEGDNLDPEVWSATMGDSIMNGIGERLNKQEAKSGAKVSISAPMNITLAGVTFPVTVSTGYEYSYQNYIEDMTLTAGTLQVVTSGLYLIIGSVICDFVAAGTPVNLSLNVNAENVISEALETSPTTWASKTLTTTAFLIAGDSVYFRGQTAAGIAADIPVRGANLNVTILYAT